MQQCITESSANTLLTYADESGDEYLNVQLAGLSESKIIAMEYKYHRSCYRNITRETTTGENAEASRERALREKCFEKLKNFVEQEVIQNGEFLRLTNIAEYYGHLQDDAKLKRIGLIVRNLKQRLLKAFGDRITIFQKSQGMPEIIYGTEEVKLNLDSSLKKVKEIGRLIREELMNAPEIYSCWPPTEKELLQNEFEIPPFTEAFLISVLSAKGKKTERTSRLISSIAQDLMYNASTGRKRTKKHVQLAIATKRKTASISVIRWLNRFGHIISYDEVNAVETKLAEDQIRNVNIRKYVPNSIQPSTFVTFVYDNCDHNAESIYNITLHGTNGIVIQRYI